MGITFLSANLGGVSRISSVAFTIQPNRNLCRVSFIYTLELVVAHRDHVSSGSWCFVDLCSLCHGDFETKKSVYIYIL